jgi:hypothetical protein
MYGDSPDDISMAIKNWRYVSMVPVAWLMLSATIWPVTLIAWRYGLTLT